MIYLLSVQVSGSDEVFMAGMQAVVQLSTVVGPALNAHLKILLSSVNCHCLPNVFH